MHNWPVPQLTPWLAALRSGQPVAAPAEGVYGYVANPFSSHALQAILELKQRSAAKGFIVLVQSPSQLAQLCPALPPECEAAIDTYWNIGKDPVTLILPALGNLSPLITGGFGTVAVRLPHTPYMQSYLRAAAIPLVSTSLNISGEAAATSAAAIPSGIPALTLEETLSGTPSRIFNPLTSQWLR